MSSLLLLLAALWPLAKDLPDDAVIARAQSPQGEITITAGRLRRYAADRPSQDPKALVQDLIDLELLHQEALRRGLDKDPQALEAIEPVMVRRFLKRHFEPKWVEETVPEDWVKRAYQRNISRFKHPDLIEGVHVLVHKDAKFPPLALADQAEALAEKIHAALAADPPKDKDAFITRVAAFEAEAEALGLNLRAEHLGWFAERGRMVPEFTAPIFKAKKPGAIIGPIPTQFGLHTVQILDFRAAKNQSLAEVSADIRRRMVSELRVEKLRALIREKGAARAMINTGPLEQLEARQKLEATQVSSPPK